MKLSTKIFLPIILISALLILLNGCFGVPSPGYTPETGTITGIIAAPCCSTSADPVSETCCIAPEYWCFYCQGNWLLQDSIGVVLTYGEDVVAATTTNKYGEFTFTNVSPGKNYVITAYCPDYDDNRPLVKDVALELIEGGSFDTNITDLVSTSLGLVVDFLVLYTEWGPEDISLDEVLADRPNFPNFPKFKALIYEVRRVVENCEVNLLTDDDVQYATCRAAEEISGLEIGCGPGYTEGDTPDSYTLTLKADPVEGAASLTGAGTYDEGTTQGVNTGANPCYEFTGWTVDVGNSANVSGDLGTTPLSVKMNENMTLTAHFECQPNNEPEISNIPPATVQMVNIGETYTYDVDATDPDGDNLTYTLTTKPNGMTINPSTGEITWPGANCVVTTELGLVLTKGDRCHKLCDIDVTVKVSDDGCCESLFDEESFIVEVWQP